MNQEIFWGLGRRKTSTARARLLPGNGKIVVNKVDNSHYFHGIGRFIEQVKAPLEVTRTLDKYDIRILVNGGGNTGQAGAIKLAIARALVLIDDSNKSILRKAGMLTRDSRMVERKKPGQPKARKKFQFSKR